MKILTVSSSPYLLTRFGRINAEILKFLKTEGHEVASACYHHDPTWFAPDEKGNFDYTTDSGYVCKLYPFRYMGEKSSPFVYEICKHYNPELVISIGDYNDVDFIFALKALNPDIIKWLNVVGLDASPINKSRNKAFEYMDHVVSLNEFGNNEIIKHIDKNKVTYCPFGVDLEIFNANNQKNEEEIKIFGCGKNAQGSNLGVQFKAISLASKEEKILYYLHTNHNDIGDHDLYELSDRYDIDVKFPDNFSSLNDGMSDADLSLLYGSYDLVLDTSAKASTGMSLLEGMACGCIPVASGTEMFSEIIRKMPEEYQYIIDSNLFVGAMDEEYYMASPESLKNIILKLSNLKKKDYNKFNDIKIHSKKVAQEYDRKNFLKIIKEAIGKTMKNNKEEIKVEII